MNNSRRNELNGIFTATAAFILWGILPLYWKLLSHISATSILANRIIWSLIFTMVLIFVQSRWEEFKAGFANGKDFFLLLLRSFFIGANWLVFIWGINNGHVLQCSLGYFINPLVVVVLGCIFLKERLNKIQILSLLITCTGVLILIVNYGHVPWVSFLVALTFGFYSLLKKTSSSEALTGLAGEVAVLTVPAIIYLVFLSVETGSILFFRVSAFTNFLLIFSGVVTAVPLLLFANGIRKIKLSLAGPLQYIAPTCTFLLGVFVFKEKFTNIHLYSFILIWISLIIFTWNSVLINSKK